MKSGCLAGLTIRKGGGGGAASADLGRRFEMSSARTLPALHASYRSYIIAGQRKEKKRNVSQLRDLKALYVQKVPCAVGQMRDAEGGAEAFKLRLENESVALFFISRRVCLCHV